MTGTDFRAPPIRLVFGTALDDESGTCNHTSKEQRDNQHLGYGRPGAPGQPAAWIGVNHDFARSQTGANLGFALVVRRIASGEHDCAGDNQQDDHSGNEVERPLDAPRRKIPHRATLLHREVSSRFRAT